MSGYAKNLELYSDCQRAFEVAMANLPSETKLVFADKRKATNWRNRANYYRALLRTETMKAYQGTDRAYLAGTSPFDKLVLRVRQLADEHVVIIGEYNPEILRIQRIP